MRKGNFKKDKIIEWIKIEKRDHRKITENYN